MDRPSLEMPILFAAPAGTSSDGTVPAYFTLPHELSPLLALQNKRVIYDLLFRTSAETLLEIARDP